MTTTVAISDTKPFSGSYLLYRKVGGKNVKPGVRSQARAPRFRHPTFEAAQAEATRLLEHHPESTFIILQERGRVKLRSPDEAQEVR